MGRKRARTGSRTANRANESKRAGTRRCTEPKTRICRLPAQLRIFSWGQRQSAKPWSGTGLWRRWRETVTKPEGWKLSAATEQLLVAGS